MTFTQAKILMMLAVTPVFCNADLGEDQKALESFNVLVRRHVSSYQSGGREHITKLGGGWAKERFMLDPASAKFDVEKTSSLVSPFVATLTFTLTRDMTEFHLTQSDAAADVAFVKRDRAIHKHIFAFQDHEWQPTNREYQTPDSVFDTTLRYPCDEFLTRHDKPSEQDIHGCLEEFDSIK